MPSVLSTLTANLYGDAMREEDMKRLEAVARVTRRPDLARCDEDTLIAALKAADADIMISAWKSPRVSMKVHKAWPKLKYVAHASGEMKWLVDRDVMEAGMIVTNWGNCTSHSTAEGNFAMTLAILRHYYWMREWVEKENLFWELPAVDEGLFEQRVGVHGLGAIAQEYVKLCKPWNCKISAYSPHVPDKVFEELGIRRAKTLEELYSTNRIISCHAANTPENFHIINARLLAMMEDGAYFINTGRGPVVDTEALLAELRRKRIWAALDVFETEPIPADSPIWGTPNLMIVPHKAGPTADRRMVMGRHVVDNIINYINGKPLDGVIDLKKYDLMS